jgi:hypothetical protein
MNDYNLLIKHPKLWDLKRFIWVKCLYRTRVKLAELCVKLKYKKGANFFVVGSRVRIK